MPTPSPSSEPANLTTIPAVESFLSGTIFSSKSIADVSKYINYSYRVQLVTPFQNHPSVILKHAQSFFKGRPDNSFDVIRQVRVNRYPPQTIIITGLPTQTYEVEALTRIKSWLPPGSLVTVPEVLHFDRHNRVIIMEDLGSDCITLDRFLYLGGPIAPGMAETIGSALGKFSASMHQWSRGNPGGILDAFRANTTTREMNARETYTRMIHTLQYTGEHLPLLGSPPLDIDQSDLEKVFKLGDELKNVMLHGSPSDVVSLGLLRQILPRLTSKSSSWATSGRTIS
jgi:hypothetical protein